LSRYIDPLLNRPVLPVVTSYRLCGRQRLGLFAAGTMRPKTVGEFICPKRYSISGTSAAFLRD